MLGESRMLPGKLLDQGSSSNFKKPGPAPDPIPKLGLARDADPGALSHSSHAVEESARSDRDGMVRDSKECHPARAESDVSGVELMWLCRYRWNLLERVLGD